MNENNTEIMDKFSKNVNYFQFNIAFAAQANVLRQFARNLKIIKQNAHQQEVRLVDKLNQ